MRTWIAILLLTGWAGADEMTGVLVKSGPNQIEVKDEQYRRVVKLELKSGAQVPCKVGERIWVDYTPHRVAVAQEGQRACMQFLDVNAMKPAPPARPK